MSTQPQSLWHATHPLRSFSPVAADLETDVVVVGGGISGLTAAVLLARAGRRVILLERERIGSGETGNTTSHLTEAIDARYHSVIRDFGEEGATLVARSQRAAIGWIEAVAASASIDCGFTRVPGYLYTETTSDLDSLANELDAARRAGCDAEWMDDVPLPFATKGGIRWNAQAQVHSTAYLDALLTEAAASGVRIFDHTRVRGVEEGEPCTVETAHGSIRARHVFVAANVPINNRVLLHTKIAAYRSYAVAVDAPATLPPGLFWDTADPYHYTRTQRAGGRNYLIVGGEDHRTGMKTDTDACYQRLLDYTQQHFGPGAAQFRWSGQIIEPVDGLPYIGVNAAEQHVYVATGYSGNGMTFGTLAGMIVSDLILGRENPYAVIYDATRVKPVAGAVDYVKENVVFPARLVADRLTSITADDRPIETLQPGEGAVLQTEKGKVAVCRDARGEIHAVSAVCTHLGCDVAWNRAEQTWDCPCHGSRFAPDGTVINGPAVTGLPGVQVTPAPLSR